MHVFGYMKSITSSCFALIFLLVLTTFELFMQINASDDRTSSTIESKILDAIQMNSVLGDARPNCLVSLSLSLFSPPC